METEVLLNKHTSRIKNEWSTMQLVCIVALCVILSTLGSNMDRIIKALKYNDSVENQHKYDKYDIVIVGAGITGLTHSYFLNEYYDYKILTVERFNRVGGRTHSVHLKYNESTIVFENGAIQFPYDSNLYKLLSSLDLCNDRIIFSDSSINRSPNYLYRNVWAPVQAINATNYWAQMYNFHNKELNWFKSDENLFDIGYNEILLENNGIAPLTDLEWNEFWTNWTFKGVPIRDWSQYAFIKHAMNASVEYLNYLVDNPSRSSLSKEHNLAKLIEQRHRNPSNGSISISNPSITLQHGYDQICRRMHDKISSSANNEFLFEHKVIAVKYNDNNANKAKYPYIVHIQDVYDENIISKVYASKIILTIAPTQLKQLLPYTIPIDNQYTKKLINSVPQIKAYKINLIYDSVFWLTENLTLLASNSRTDDSLGSFYIEKAWSNDTLTTIHIYAVGDKSGLWHTLQSLDDPYPMHDGIETDNMNGLIVASKFVVDEATKQLRLLTKKYIPLPIAAFVNPMGWNDSNSDGFYLNWKYGHIESNILQNIFRPNDDENIYISSSSYSIDKAYHAGGIWAALENLKRHFDIGEPLENHSECPRIY